MRETESKKTRARRRRRATRRKDAMGVHAKEGSEETKRSKEGPRAEGFVRRNVAISP